MKSTLHLTGALILSTFFLTVQGQSSRKLVFSDEFNYSGFPDPTKWVYEEGFIRNVEPQYYTVKRLENCRVENGMLVIEARKEDFKNPFYKPGSTVRLERTEVAPYTSASINTYGKHSWQYGRIEVRAKLPGGLGSWPAIWMLGDSRKEKPWPLCGEIDIMEFLGRDSLTLHATVHYADSAGTHQQQGKDIRPGRDMMDNFHVYAVDWSADRIDFYYDNQKYYTFEYSKVKGASVEPFRKKFFLLLNLAFGRQGNWAGPTNDKIFPVKYYIDYVRVYQ